MEKRKFGNTGVELFPLGFGCMRLPLLDQKDTKSIDYDKSIEIVRNAIDNGVNYIDTAYPYHGGESERFVAKALKDGYREKVYLATKSPIWAIKEEGDFLKLFNEQLEKLEDNCIDFYLLHALNKERLETIIKFGIFEKALKLKEEGKIKFLGFSFHDEYKVFEEIINTYPTFDFCQIQLNYLDTDYQAGEKGLKFAHEKGLGVIIMEPLKGGRLYSIPSSMTDVLSEVNKNRDSVKWAFDYLLDKEEVGLILSGMNEQSQVDENIDIVKKASVSMLTDKEREALVKVKNIFNDIKVVPCTNCKYCLPCPHGIDIPNNFMLLNDYKIFDRKGLEYSLMPSTSKAWSCKECGVCEAKCPQNIKIIEELKRVNKELA